MSSTVIPGVVHHFLYRHPGRIAVPPFPRGQAPWCDAEPGSRYFVIKESGIPVFAGMMRRGRGSIPPVGTWNGRGPLVVTGPTRTNVNDFRAILVE